MIKNKIDVLVVGFGMMGCRHVQALLSDKERFSVHLFEPSLETIQINSARIGASASDFKSYQYLNDIPVVDVVIVATSSAPRFEIVKSLIHLGCKLFLLEKIVFQSEIQFIEIIELMNKYGVKAYCNFVNRYFNAYNEIKSELNNFENLEIVVSGNAFGLGCNAIHYIDIFQYLSTTDSLYLDNSLLHEFDIVNRRGAEYKEFTGILSFSNNNNDRLLINADSAYNGGITIHIRQGNKLFLLNEFTQKYYSISSGFIQERTFVITPTSLLTDKIVVEIINDDCRLTTVQETLISHKLLFQVFNTTIFGKHSNSLNCPIT